MQLPFGVGYLVPSAILGAEELSSQALQVRGEVLHFMDTILRLTHAICAALTPRGAPLYLRF